MNRDEESRLVAECRRGNRQALGELVDAYQKPVFNAVYRMLGNADEAADVTQTTFLKALERIDTFDEKYRFFSWLYRIGLNEAIDRLKTGRRQETYVDTAADPTPKPPEQVASLQASDQLQAALLEIKEELREVLVLRYFTECSYHQIGEILELPDKTVKSRLFSARQQLKARLAAHGLTSL